MLISSHWVVIKFQRLGMYIATSYSFNLEVRAQVSMSINKSYKVRNKSYLKSSMWISLTTQQ